jgi:hypothetical protein
MLCAVGRVGDLTVSFIHKKVTFAVPDLTLCGAPPMYFVLNVGGDVSRRGTVLEAFCDAVSEFTGNVLFSSPMSTDFSEFRSLEHGLSFLTDNELATMRGDIHAKEVRMLSPYDKKFLRCFADLVASRKARSLIAASTMMWSVAALPFPICPFGRLKNLGQRGYRLQEQTGVVVSYTLLDILQTPALCAQYCIVLMSTSSLTGIGKTEFAKFLAVHMSTLMALAAGKDRASARVAVVTTLDVLKNLTLRCGDSLLLDELDPKDEAQCQSMSENLLKTFFSPLTPAVIHCRNADAVLPCGLFRFITCNADSPQQWIGDKRGMTWSPPLQRKAIVFQLTHAICEPNWSTSASYVAADEAQSDVALPLDEARELLLNCDSYRELREREDPIHPETSQLAGPPVSLMNRIAGGAILGAALCSVLAEGIATQL